MACSPAATSQRGERARWTDSHRYVAMTGLGDWLGLGRVRVQREREGEGERERERRARWLGLDGTGFFAGVEIGIHRLSKMNASFLCKNSEFNGLKLLFGCTFCWCKIAT